MKIILDAKQIKSAIDDLAGQIMTANSSGKEVAVIGLKSGGEIVARRLCAKLEEMDGLSVRCGALDITLYRDDINDPHGSEQLVVRSTEIPFDITDTVVILVDDVLHTGRSIRAAMDALIDLGRPEAIRLAVLVDRGHRELPIQADYYAHKVDVASDKIVSVNFIETNDFDQVIVE